MLLLDVRLLLLETALLELVERLEETAGRDWAGVVDRTVVARLFPELVADDVLLLPAFVADDALTVFLLDAGVEVRFARLCVTALLLCVRALGAVWFTLVFVRDDGAVARVFVEERAEEARVLPLLV